MPGLPVKKILVSSDVYISVTDIGAIMKKHIHVWRLHMRDVKKALSIVIIAVLTLVFLPALGIQKAYAETSQDVSATESIELEKYSLNLVPFDDDIREGQFGDVIKVTKGKAVDVKVLDANIAEAYIDSYYTWSEDFTKFYILKKRI